jgi:hypothetical protein
MQSESSFSTIEIFILVVKVLEKVKLISKVMHALGLSPLSLIYAHNSMEKEREREWLLLNDGQNQRTQGLEGDQQGARLICQHSHLFSPIVLACRPVVCG